MVGTNTLLHNDSEKRSEKNKKKGGLSIQIMLVWDIVRLDKRRSQHKICKSSVASGQVQCTSTWYTSLVAVSCFSLVPGGRVSSSRTILEESARVGC